MIVVTGAYAFRHEVADEGRKQLANCQQYKHPIGCPKGCCQEYDLFVSLHATEQEIHIWIDTLHNRMVQVCPKHENCITF